MVKIDYRRKDRPKPNQVQKYSGRYYKARLDKALARTLRNKDSVTIDTRDKSQSLTITRETELIQCFSDTSVDRQQLKKYHYFEPQTQSIISIRGNKMRLLKKHKTKSGYLYYDISLGNGKTKKLYTLQLLSMIAPERVGWFGDAQEQLQTVGIDAFGKDEDKINTHHINGLESDFARNLKVKTHKVLHAANSVMKQNVSLDKEFEFIEKVRKHLEELGINDKPVCVVVGLNYDKDGNPLPNDKYKDIIELPEIKASNIQVINDITNMINIAKSSDIDTIQEIVSLLANGNQEQTDNED